MCEKVSRMGMWRVRRGSLLPLNNEQQQKAGEQWSGKQLSMGRKKMIDAILIHRQKGISISIQVPIAVHIADEPPVPCVVVGRRFEMSRVAHFGPLCAAISGKFSTEFTVHNCFVFE
jgi:hypothetical protein